MENEWFGSFYTHTAGRLRAYLRSVMRDDSTVDDLLQESYVRLINAGLPPDLDEPRRRNYVYRIAINLVRDHWRERRSESVGGRDAIGLQADLGEARDVRDALDSLKPKERDLLWLAYVEQFSHDEIAGLIGAKPASIRPMLARARVKFAASLKRGGYGGEARNEV
jgi:RNA polymerase sigma-70 factor (ECF subfamily)